MPVQSSVRRERNDMPKLLASGAASFLTGQAITVDGGATHP
jgi:hypothetical protein